MNFIKMQGLGNDYVYVNYLNPKLIIEEYISNHKEEFCNKKYENLTSDEETKILGKISKVISNRHFGIGSDGLILICKSKVADFKMRMFNFDGSEAEMCGNGIRCVAKYIYDNNLSKKENLYIETLAGIKKLKLNIKDDKVDTVKVDMGIPILDVDKIPVILDKENKKNKVKIKVLDKEFEFTCVSMGNPHAITFIDDVEKFDVEKYGKILEVDKHFPNRANIEFIEIVNRKNIKMRVWERGSGETLACGTGATASVVAGNLNGYLDNKVEVNLLGGNLNIEITESNHIYMTGKATTVFEGNIKI